MGVYQVFSFWKLPQLAAELSVGPRFGTFPFRRTCVGAHPLIRCLNWTFWKYLTAKVTFAQNLFILYKGVCQIKNLNLFRVSMKNCLGIV